MRENEVSQEYLKKSRQVIGEQLRKKRLKKGYSVTDLANKLGWKAKTIDNIENGIFPADLDQISKINYFLS